MVITYSGKRAGIGRNILCPVKMDFPNWESILEPTILLKSTILSAVDGRTLIIVEYPASAYLQGSHPFY